MSSHFTVIKSGGSAIDAPIAALAGLSVAFAAFTIPADLLGQLVVATGLPSIVPVAQPPLGLNARLLLAGFGAIGVFAVAFVALRLLGRIGRRPRRVEIEEAIEEATPVRLRRRDFHPDAPPPAPLRARELGEPMTPGLWDRAEREAPETPAATTVEAGSAIFEAEPEVAAPEPSRPQPTEPPAHPRARRSWLRDAVIETEAAVEPPVAPAPAPEPVPEPAPMAAEPEWEPEIEVELADVIDVGADAAGDAPAIMPAFIEERAEPVASAAADREAEPSLAELVERLQRGIERRSPRPAPRPAEPTALFGGSTDDRLQSAIDSLQRLAARQG